MSEHVRALVAEAGGTFMFFFIGAGAIVAGVAGGGGGGGIGSIALAHGLALAVAVSTFGALSGGHFNPAVSFGLAVAGKHPWPRVPTYWAAQLVGALAAGAALRYAFDFAPTALDIACTRASRRSARSGCFKVRDCEQALTSRSGATTWTSTPGAGCWCTGCRSSTTTLRISSRCGV